MIIKLKEAGGNGLNHPVCCDGQQCAMKRHDCVRKQSVSLKPKLLSLSG